MWLITLCYLLFPPEAIHRICSMVHLPLLLLAMSRRNSVANTLMSSSKTWLSLEATMALSHSRQTEVKLLYLSCIQRRLLYFLQAKVNDHPPLNFFHHANLTDSTISPRITNILQADIIMKERIREPRHHAYPRIR